MADQNLATLRARLKLLANPPSGYTLTDDDYDEYLQAHRVYVTNERLRTQNNLFFSSMSDTFDDAVALADSAGTVVAPDTSNPVEGFWQFSTARGAVYLSGWSYDLYAAAAAIWERCAEQAATTFDATVDGSSYSRSQIATAFERAAARCRSRARATVAEVYRDYR